MTLIHDSGHKISFGDEFLGPTWPICALDRHIRETFIVFGSFSGDGVGELSCEYIFLHSKGI